MSKEDNTKSAYVELGFPDAGGDAGEGAAYCEDLRISCASSMEPEEGGKSHGTDTAKAGKNAARAVSRDQRSEDDGLPRQARLLGENL